MRSMLRYAAAGRNVVRNAVIVTLIVFLLSACAALTPRYEQPGITVTSFRLLPADSVNPKFEIGLHITNPNAVELALRGVAYSASIENQEILTGVSNQLPVIDAYGEGDVTLVATANLISGFRLFTRMMLEGSSTMNYQLRVKLDVGRILSPIVVEKQGKLLL